MAIPDNSLSSSPVLSQLVSPYAVQGGRLYAYATGGKAIQDPTEGINGYTWACWRNRQNEVRAKRMDLPGEGTVLITAPGITSLSFAFDRNMQPALVYEQNGVQKFRWYDTTVSGFVTTTYSDIRTPRLIHDDTRDVAATFSDVLLVYLRGKNLAYRQQRDRYLVEYVLASNIALNYRLTKVAMNTKWRLQFQLR